VPPAETILALDELFNAIGPDQVLIFLVHVIHLFYLWELKGVWHGIDWDNPQGVVFTQGP
jgi:hypothetical protein